MIMPARRKKAALVAARPIVKAARGRETIARPLQKLLLKPPSSFRLI
jgi:hypothetical protein